MWDPYKKLSVRKVSSVLVVGGAFQMLLDCHSHPPHWLGLVETTDNNVWNAVHSPALIYALENDSGRFSQDDEYQKNARRMTSDVAVSSSFLRYT